MIVKYIDPFDMGVFGVEIFRDVNLNRANQIVLFLEPLVVEQPNEQQFPTWTVEFAHFTPIRVHSSSSANLGLVNLIFEFHLNKWVHLSEKLCVVRNTGLHCVDGNTRDYMHFVLIIIILINELCTNKNQLSEEIKYEI